MADTAQRTGLKLRRTENSAGTEGSPSDIVKDKYLEPQLISPLPAERGCPLQKPGCLQVGIQCSRV